MSIDILPGEAPYKNRKQAAKKRAQGDFTHTKEDWDALITGSYYHEQIRKAVDDIDWQKFRIHLLGMSHDYRYNMLHKYLHELDDVQPLLLHTPEEWSAKIELRRVRVTNYVNALRRGGLIP